MKHTQIASMITHTKIALTCLFIFPVLAGLVWGLNFTEDVYILLRYAQNLANDGGLVYDAVAGFTPPSLTNPLFAATIGVLSKTLIDPEIAALLSSIAGWLVTGIAIFLIGRQVKRQAGSATAVFLLSFNPFIIVTLGNAQSWSLAMGWLSMAWLVCRRRLAYIIAMALFFGLNPNLFSPVWALLLGVYETWREKRFPADTAVATTAGILVWAALGIWTLQWQKLPDMILIQAALWTVMLFWTGIGTEWLGAHLIELRLVDLVPTKLQIGLSGIVIILLGLIQGQELWTTYRERPLAQWQMETNVAAWIRAQTPSDTSLFTSEKVGYLANRNVISPSALGTLLDTQSIKRILLVAPVDFLISPNVIIWQNLAASPWFRLSYSPTKRFEDPYAPGSPYTVWTYRPPLDGWSERQVLNIQVPDRLDILGYQFESQHIHPGETLQIALYLQTPEALIEPPASSRVFVRLVSPIDGRALLEWEERLPQSLDAANWKPGQLILERITIPIPNHFQIGAYVVNISLGDATGDNFWPLSRDNDINPLDRFSLGFVSIPWSGSLDNVQPRTALVGDQIKLLGFSLSEPHQEESLPITLYWQTLQSVNENYVVFIHITDTNGQLFANHDAIPLNGRYPTIAWLANDVISDEHIVSLPADLPAGEYQIKVGMYLPETGERLPAADDNGVLLQDNAVLLTRVSFP